VLGDQPVYRDAAAHLHNLAELFSGLREAFAVRMYTFIGSSIQRDCILIDLVQILLASRLLVLTDNGVQFGDMPSRRSGGPDT
jgi:hypothetical protein